MLPTDGTRLWSHGSSTGPTGRLEPHFETLISKADDDRLRILITPRIFRRRKVCLSLTRAPPKAPGERSCKANASPARTRGVDLECHRCRRCVAVPGPGTPACGLRESHSDKESESSYCCHL